MFIQIIIKIKINQYKNKKFFFNHFKVFLQWALKFADKKNRNKIKLIKIKYNK